MNSLFLNTPCPHLPSLSAWLELVVETSVCPTKITGNEKTNIFNGTVCLITDEAEGHDL